MSVSATFAEVVKMMDVCAKGWSWRMANHSRVVHYNGLVFRTLPKHDDFQVGFVRKMARHFAILDCAKKQMTSLK